MGERGSRSVLQPKCVSLYRLVLWQRPTTLISCGTAPTYYTLGEQFPVLCMEPASL